MSPKIVFFIPAAGSGTRMLPLTMHQAKPSLPLYFDDCPSIYRLIDLAFTICQELNARAYVTTYYERASLSFLNKRNAEILAYDKPDIDYCLYKSLPLLKKSQADILCYLPADSIVPAEVVKNLVHMVDNNTYAALLSTGYLKGHNTRLRSKEGFLTTDNGEACGDLGIYAINLKWFWEESERTGSIDILRGWEKSRFMDRVKLYIPENDPVHNVDLGTPGAYYEAVTKLNAKNIDANGNLVFPNAMINEKSRNIIALPDSDSRGTVLEHCIIPEGQVVNRADQVLSVENKGEDFFWNMESWKPFQEQQIL